MKRLVITAAALLGLSAGLLGAFGAHGLKGVLTPEQLGSFETGVRYQVYHALALLGVAALFPVKVKIVKVIFTCFLAGTLLFSGSIYLLACRDLLGDVQLAWLGPITPLGGLLLASGWVAMAIAGWKERG